MSQEEKVHAFFRIPNEIWLEIFKIVDVLEDGRGMVCATKRYSELLKGHVAGRVDNELHTRFPAAWVAQFPDFESPANRLHTLCRQTDDLKVLKQILGASRFLFAQLPLAPMPNLNLVPYKNNPACSLLSPFLLGINALAARSVHVDTFHTFLETTDMHYKEFATIEHIVQQIKGWSRLQVLQITCLGQIVGWILCLLVEEHRATEQEATEYVEAATLVLLLCGVRPILEAIINTARNHSNATIRQGFAPATQLVSKRDLRAARKLAQDAAAWAQVYFDKPEQPLTFERALEHVGWTDTYVQIQEGTSHQEGLGEGWKVGEEELKELVRVDLLFAARRKELLEGLNEDDLKNGSVLVGQIAAEASR